MSWHQAAAPGVLRVRRASLKAVARVHGAPEPSDSDCNHASWGAGLQGAYRSLPGRSAALVLPGAPALPAVRAPTYRPSLAWALATGVAAFALALWAAPGTALWETRGHLPLAQRMGVPGGPDALPFAALARAWSLLLAPVAGLDVALTLFALASVAALAAAAFLLLERLVRAALGRKQLSAAAALGLVLTGVAALAGLGASVTAGNDLVLAAGAFTAAAWLVLRWHETRAAPRSTRYLLVASHLTLLAAAGAAPLVLPIGSGLLLALRLTPRRGL